VISHDIGAAFQIGDNLGVINEGRLVAEGSPAEVRKTKEPFTQQFLATWFGRTLDRRDVRSCWTPLRVGLVVALAVAAFGFGLYLIGAEKFGANRSYNVEAVFDDATGLGVRSRVQLACIRIA